jgi:hypothetical protein
MLEDKEKIVIKLPLEARDGSGGKYKQRKKKANFEICIYSRSSSK